MDDKCTKHEQLKNDIVDAQIQVMNTTNEIKRGHSPIDYAKKKEEPGSTQTETKKSKKGEKKEFIKTFIKGIGCNWL
eukprot:5321524-Heterocapsa_arctica.AAC.2